MQRGKVKVERLESKEGQRKEIWCGCPLPKRSPEDRNIAIAPPLITLEFSRDTPRCGDSIDR